MISKLEPEPTDDGGQNSTNLHFYGPTCSETEKPNNNECGHCINGVENNWDENPYTGCDCLNTGHWGWHCELDNKLLCEHVDRGKFVLKDFLFLFSFRRPLEERPSSRPGFSTVEKRGVW